jgi:hypothetical protein
MEIAIAFIFCFGILKMNSNRPKEPINIPEHFKTKDEQAILLWKNITHDVNKYEANSFYFFNSVRIYKYSTIILSGISTIVLGLDLGDIKIGFMDYATFSKNTALIIGAIITVSTSLMVYWNIEKYWLINKKIVNKLKDLRDEIEDADASNSLQNEIKEKIKKYKEVKENFNKYWEGVLSERSSQSLQQK